MKNGQIKYFGSNLDRFAPRKLKIFVAHLEYARSGKVQAIFFIF